MLVIQANWTLDKRWLHIYYHRHFTTAIIGLCIILNSSLVNIGSAAEPEAQSVSSIIERFKSPDKGISFEANRQLIKLGGPAVPALIPLLSDLNPEIRTRAAWTIGSIGPAAKEAVPHLIELLRRPTELDSVRQPAARALGLIGPDAVPDLLQALKHADNRTRYFITYAQGMMRDSANPALLEALKHDDPAIRALAAIALGRGGYEAETTIPLLIEIVKSKDEDKYIRSTAAFSLGYYKESARKATEVLLGVTVDRNEILDLRNHAVMSLGVITPPPDLVFSPLTELLKSADEDEIVRRNTAISLGQIGEPPDKIVALLIGIIKDQNSPAAVKSGAAVGLSYMESEAAPAIAELITMLKDADFRIQKDAKMALLRIPPQGKNADPALRTQLSFFMNWLDRGNREQKLMAILAISHIGPAAAAATPKFLMLLDLRDDAMIRQAATGTIGYIGQGDPSVIAALTAIIRSENEDIQLRGYALTSLAQTGPEAGNALWSLSDIFRDNSPSVLKQAYASAIVSAEPKDKKILPDIIKALDDPNEDIHDLAAFFLLIMANNLQPEIENVSLAELALLSEGLTKAKSLLDASDAPAAFRKLLGSPEAAFAKELEIRTGGLLAKTMAWCGQHKIVSGMILYAIVMPVLWLTILWTAPLSILKLNNALTPFKDIKLSGWLGGLNLPIRLALMIKPFVYHRRVLDAWVSLHAASVRENFAGKQTVRERAVFVSMPVVLNGKTIANLSGGHLGPLFTKQRVRLLIWGEGGSGKTSLACRIALWALSDDKSQWICNHRMLPILVEHDLDDAATNEKNALKRAIQGQIDDLVGRAQSIPEEFLNNLLKQRRLLIIVDHLSEMTPATRSQVRPELSDFPANALIVTSRIKEPLGGVTKSICKPLRISGNHLSSFMEAYLTQRGKRELFNDSEFFEGCQKLSAMVSDRQITALMAKLFAEQMILTKEDDSESELPANLPELMLSYLNELYHNASRDELRSVQQDAKRIAWECLRGNLTPAAAGYDKVVQALGGDSVEKRINILEQNLRLTTTVGAAHDKIRFNLDPLAEYLAALFLVEAYPEDGPFWEALIDRFREHASTMDRINEFVLAICECWAVKGMDQKLPRLADDLYSLGSFDANLERGRRPTG